MSKRTANVVIQFFLFFFARHPLNNCCAQQQQQQQQEDFKGVTGESCGEQNLPATSFSSEGRRRRRGRRPKTNIALRFSSKHFSSMFQRRRKNNINRRRGAEQDDLENKLDSSLAKGFVDAVREEEEEEGRGEDLDDAGDGDGEGSFESPTPSWKLNRQVMHLKKMRRTRLYFNSYGVALFKRLSSLIKLSIKKRYLNRPGPLTKYAYCRFTYM